MVMIDDNDDFWRPDMMMMIMMMMSDRLIDRVRVILKTLTILCITHISHIYLIKTHLFS